jgi:phosphate binding protein
MSKLARLIALVAVFAVIAAACGGDDDATDTTEAATDTTEAMDDTTTTEAMDGDDGDASEPFVPEGLPTIDPLDADPSLTIGIAGSSTVFPLSTAVMAKWEDEGGPNYPIDSIGSGGGIERFCVEGASDVANASRAIKDEEVAACADIDRTVIEVRVGSDALTLVVSPGNYFATDLTLEQIATAYSLTDAGATWADVDPSFPAHPIGLFTPGTDSGTFDYFNEVVFDEADPSPIVSSIAQNVGEDDNVTVQGVSEDGCTEGDLSTTCAIGYFGFAYFQENSSVLQPVSVDGVAPSEDSVNDGTYPISRPLYMYTAEEVIAEKPHVANFIAYYLSNVNDVIGEVGYFPAPNEALQEAADNLSAAAGF